MFVFRYVIYLLIVISVPDYKLCANQLELEDVQMQLWLSGEQVVNASYTWNDAVSFINGDLGAVKGWASDTTPVVFCSLIHRASWGRIWSLSYFYSLNALFVRDVVIPLFEENDYVLIPFWGEVSETGGCHKALLKNARFPQNFYFLGNSDQCTNALRSEGVQAFTVSHNAFIDQNLFKPINVSRIYDAVYLGCCRPQKRLELASYVLPQLQVITISPPEQRMVIANAKNIIFNPSQSSISYYLSQGHCGLILSEAEGGCYSSTEYLYCGVPVVSTKSRGGRDAYYDDVTAIVVDDTPEDVRRGVEIMLQRAPDPWEVRRRALAVSDRMLDTLAFEILLPIFARYGDIHAGDPRGFVNEKINQSKRKSSKGRTVFQPEMPTHDRVEKILKEQSKNYDGFKRKKDKKRRE